MGSTAPAPLSVLVEDLREARARTLSLVAALDASALEAQHVAFLSPLVWDLGHIAAYEDLWLVHRHGGEPLLREDLLTMYDAFETPRDARGDLPLLDTGAALDYLEAVRARTLRVLGRIGAGDGVIAELVLRHEHQHGETMLQAAELAGLPWAAGRAARPPGPPTGTGLERVSIAGGGRPIGAPGAGFAYDNERPRHSVDVAPFAIGRTPVTNATYLTFTEGGGYVRREWWSDEGWAWKEEYDITHPGGPTHLAERPADAPVMHLSWFEADAFARAHGARLPTEAEWETAATWDQDPAGSNLDLSALGPQPPRSATASRDGVLGLLGDVWEWTGDVFGGYPGFVPFPYREYSEVFFGPEYRTLRGGSWATRTRIATPTFRNWDLPIRRQLFAGVRLAWDD